MYFVRIGLDLDIAKYQTFLSSWVYKDGHCYISYTNVEKETFRISLNFPNADKLISAKISQLIEKNIENNDISRGLLGYQFESSLFLAFTAKELTIVKKGASVSGTINCCCPNNYRSNLLQVFGFSL